MNESRRREKSAARALAKQAGDATVVPPENHIRDDALVAVW
jgi:hypothetical protein